MPSFSGPAGNGTVRNIVLAKNFSNTRKFALLDRGLLSDRCEVISFNIISSRV